MYRYIQTGTLILLVITACTPSTRNEDKDETTAVKKIEGPGFSIKLPTHLSETKALNNEAVLQFQNPIKEFYCIVITESAETFEQTLKDSELTSVYQPDLDGYAKLIGDRFEENVEKLNSKSETKAIKLKNNNARYFVADAKVSGIDIYYNYGFVRGDTSYYQIMSWTRSRKKEKFENDMMDILKSFTEKK